MTSANMEPGPPLMEVGPVPERAISDGGSRFTVTPPEQSWTPPDAGGAPLALPDFASDVSLTSSRVKRLTAANGRA